VNYNSSDYIQRIIPAVIPASGLIMIKEAISGDRNPYLRYYIEKSSA